MASPWLLRATSGGAGDIDADQVRRALVVLADPTAAMQVQGLPSGRWEIHCGNDLDSLTAAAQRMGGEKGVYFSLNPCPINLGKPINAKAMLRRRWMLVDVDAVRPPDTNSTDIEHGCTNELANLVMDDLAARGWPLPVTIDSGNGWHLLYRVDLANDELSRVMIRDATHALADRFDLNGVATLDRAVHNANRISKLPGTWVRKGPMSDDRPHRMARLVHVPEMVECVSPKLLTELAAERSRPESSKPLPTDQPVWNVRAGGGSTAAYAKAAIRYEGLKVRMATVGTRNETLNTSAFKLGTLDGIYPMYRQEAKAELLLATHLCDLPTDEAQDVIDRAYKAGAENPRTIPPPKGEPPHKAAEPFATNGQLLIIRASEVTPRKVEFLWPCRIPLGKLTTFAGVGGLGKTFALLDVAARVSRGSEWPDGSGECAAPGQVLFISGEDEPDDTLVPRLIELNADLNRICFLKTEAADRFTLADLPMLDKALEQIGPSVRFVAIDPPTAYLGGVDDHRNAELRALLSPLKSWAARHRLALVFNTHVTKPQGTKVEAMMRVMGSVAWVNAVRAAHMFARDPDDREKRIFAMMKSNLGPEQKALSYRLVITPELARIEWLGIVDITADEAMNRDAKFRRRSVVAADWLEEMFATEDELPSKTIYKAKDRDTTISDDAIREAKDEMGIRATQRTDPDGGRQWTWIWSPSARKAWQTKKTDQTAEVFGGESDGHDT